MAYRDRITCDRSGVFSRPEKLAERIAFSLATQPLKLKSDRMQTVSEDQIAIRFNASIGSEVSLLLSSYDEKILRLRLAARASE